MTELLQATETQVDIQLRLNRTIFIVAAVFLMAGGVSGSIWDFETGNPFLIVIDTVYLSSVALTFVFVVILRRLNTGIGLLICMSQTVLTFCLSAVVVGVSYPGEDYAWSNDGQIIFICALFGAISGISVQKWAAIGFAACAVAIQVWFAVMFKNALFYRAQLALNGTSIIVALLIVWHYRRTLEALIGELDRSIQREEYLRLQAEELRESNTPFEVFGRNTAVLVQDFDIDIEAISEMVHTLRSDRNPTRTAAILSRMYDSALNLNRRVEWVKYVSSASPERQEETLDLKRLIESAVYPFTISKQFRNMVQFELHIPDGLLVWGLRRQYLQIVENLVRNSCEAQASRIEIRLSLNGDESLLIEILDNGTGMTWCNPCESSSCLNCPHFGEGKIGETSKPHSGMRTVIATIRKLEGSLNISKAALGGVRARISIPLSEPRA